MKKSLIRKLNLKRETVMQLSSRQLGDAAGAAYTDALGCVDTAPLSFCVCPTKHVCTINC